MPDIERLHLYALWIVAFICMKQTGLYHIITLMPLSQHIFSKILLNRITCCHSNSGLFHLIGLVYGPPRFLSASCIITEYCRRSRVCTSHNYNQQRCILLNSNIFTKIVIIASPCCYLVHECLQTNNLMKQLAM